MPTHLSATNLSPIRARPAPSRVRTISFPMVSGARVPCGDEAAPSTPGGVAGRLPAPPAPREPLSCLGADVEVQVARPARPPWVQGHFHNPRSKEPCARGTPSVQGSTYGERARGKAALARTHPSVGGTIEEVCC